MYTCICQRGVKRYFREPWLGFYFYCEPWIVSYFLREPWIDLPLFSLWFVNWVLFSSWTVNWNPLFSLWFVIDLFSFSVNREFCLLSSWIFPIFPPKSICHLSLWSVTGSSWSTYVYFLRNVTTVSDHIISETKLRIMAQCLHITRQPRWLSGLTRSCVHSQWLLVDQRVLSNWDRILVRAVKGLISRAGMVSICPLLWQRDVKLQQTTMLTHRTSREITHAFFQGRI